MLKITRRRGSSSMTVARHPFIEGLRSLGSLGGDNSLFNDYLRGNDASDLKRDWEIIGSDMRKVFNSNRKCSCHNTDSRVRIHRIRLGDARP